MTQAQIIGEVLIGLCLLVVGAVCGRVFKNLWAWMNRPSTLTPQAKVQLIVELSAREEAFARLSYLGSNAKDLFLYIFQLVFAALFFLISSVLIYFAGTIDWHSRVAHLHVAVTFVLLVIADIFCIFGIVEASAMSNKKIGAKKAALQKRIDEIRENLKDASLH